jgi:hypothetical protein
MFAGGFNLDRLNTGMRMRRAHEDGSCQAFEGEIVCVAAAPTDQAFVFFAAHGIADSCLLHAVQLLPSLSRDGLQHPNRIAEAQFWHGRTRHNPA